MPALMPRPHATTRRTALAALLLGSAGLVAWQWPQHTPPRPSGNAALEGIGDDVCVVAPPTPYDPALGQPLAAAREVPADARCPVCGMYPARARAWAAQVIFADGDAYFFDSPLSLMLYLGNVAHYTRGRTAEAIVARYVTDTGTGGWLNAQEAVYVTGSSAMGPMRAGNLPAFADAEAAQRFAQQRGGRSVPFGAIDAPLLRGLAPTLRADHRRHSG
ncbi:nitrous oxide reductase accessory protein NosL [Acidovorax sp. ACV01]|uniref:nitrous oxide reductase accessory protein NosL n=1 Tax=Acidovorax sp. ACV01 TaxID=2769311 RepID=UPI00178354A1|nr:nitrous oxide reductase accessory protein NosL [Acidovorax sp. ACV01]MBD9393204.1 nitrous oxide reductase accessory protein NosL [Acidovorax sp. ACV01]